MMTRKHFEAIAEIIRRENEKLDRGEIADHRTMLNVMAHKLANVCSAASPRFDRVRFGDACTTRRQ